MLDANKNYFSTQIKGNFTFVVDPPKGKTKQAEEPKPKRKLKDPEASMSADLITKPGRKPVKRDTDTTPREKRV